MIHTEIKIYKDFWHKYIYCWICFDLEYHNMMLYIKCSVYIIKIILNHLLLDFYILLFILINKKLSSLNYVTSDTFLIENFIIFVFKKIFLKICFKCCDHVVVFCIFYDYVKFMICCVIDNQHFFNKIINAFQVFFIQAHDIFILCYNSLI